MPFRSTARFARRARLDGQLHAPGQPDLSDVQPGLTGGRAKVVCCDVPSHDPLRTTVIQALARTMVNDPRTASALAPVSVRADQSDAPLSSSSDAMTPQPEVPLPGVDDVVGGHYLLVRLLGEGMFGKVYVAERLDVREHQVALKLLQRSMYAGRNVERELVMLATVSHPNVVQLKDHGTTPDYVWLTMPVYRGETLAERLARGTMTLTEAHDVFLAVARGLEALHAAGLRHQDVKPENIFLARFGELVHPILLDLGVAAEVDAPFVAGTALYAAPEQLAVLSGFPGAYPLSEKMDTYCLATTLLMALVGSELFPGETARDRDDLAAAQVLRAARPLPEAALPFVTGPARTLIQDTFKRWLAFEPTDRPTMTQMAEQLDVLNEPMRQEERKEKARRARQKQSLARIRLALVGLLLVGIAGGAVVFWKRETIAMAGELAKAKKEGEVSFSKLDTCTAMYRVKSNEDKECESARDQDHTDFKASLDNLSKTGSEAERERARELADRQKKLRACEEQALTDKKKADEDMRKVREQADKDRDKLVAERDAANKATEQARAELAAVVSERDVVRGEMKTCAEERDGCKAALATKSMPTPSPKPAPSGAPSATPAPADTPPPAPSPAPAPPKPDAPSTP